MSSLSDAERRLRRVLRGAAFGLLALTLALAIVHEIGSAGAAFREPPWVGGAIGAGVLLVTLCVFAAGDPRGRFGLVWLVELALGVAVLAQVAYLVAGEGGERPLGADFTSSDTTMIALAAVELALALAIALAARGAQQARGDAGPPRRAAHWPTDADAGLRLLLVVLATGGTAFAALAAIGPFVDSLRELFDQPLLTAHVAAGAAAAAGLGFYVAGDARERIPLVSALAFSLAVTALAGLALALPLADLGRDVSVLGVDTTARTLLWIGIGVSAGLALALSGLRRWAFHRRLQPDFLGATEYRTLMALSDVIVQGPEEAVPPADIAANVDRYFGRIRARRRWVHRAGLIVMQLHPLLYLKAPFSELDEESRLEHLKRRFQSPEELRMVLPPLRRFVQAMIRVANQLTYVGYYNDPRSFPTVGYVPFHERERFHQLKRDGKVPDPGAHPLQVSRPADVGDTDVEADVCIVGSGAAGAILAYRLAQAGQSVVILERGQYVEPREFTSDEVEMIGKLYGDGVFQQTEDFRFTVLQGSCVGGSTVVNNAVSVRAPELVLDRWNRAHGAGLDLDALGASTAEVERWLRIGPQDPGGESPDAKLNPSYPKFLAGIERRRREDPDFRLDVSTVRANIIGCIGAGYCNIGCRYGKKLSMLDTVLPDAQREFGADKVRIFADCEVRRIVTDNGRATAVQGRLADGRTLTVRAQKVVVSAGTVSSSYLLLRSGIGKGLPVGRHVSFNMGAPLTAEFDENLDAYDGLQISHIAIPPPERGWVFETWWNPPVSQALNMPGWFEDHYENMRRYRRLMAVGALVGTDRNAWIGRAVTGGPAINYVPTPTDMRKLADGLIELGQILFAGGAKALMVNAWEYYRFTSPNGLYELPSIMRDPSMVALGTGHPQGGNAVGTDPAQSVVDPDFRVHGYSNLYVCDASVFPTSITVNPQLTVMTLANYAAPRILNGSRPT